jgi:hypothetical protein
MTTAQQYRVSAAQYAELAESAHSPSSAREFRSLERNFAALAANEDWMAGHTDSAAPSGGIIPGLPQEEQALRRLGAATVLMWSTLPAKIQRDLFECAASLSGLPGAAEFREQVGRFLQESRRSNAASARKRDKNA